MKSKFKYDGRSRPVNNLYKENFDRIFGKKIKKEISETSHQIINYLSLLFVPIGVGVVMHINYLGDNLFKILAIIVIGTLASLVFTAFVMEKIIKLEKKNVKRR